MMWRTEDIRNLRVANVRDDELDVIRALAGVWVDRLPKNQKRSLYFDTEQQFRDLGIALPPQLRNARFVLGWGTQAVRKAAMRSQFDGFRLAGSDDPLELSETLTRNCFPLEFGQAVLSAYTHGMSLVTVARGEPGGPVVQIQGHSAEFSAALWDRRKRRVSAALTIGEIKDERPVAFTVYLPHVVLECEYTPGKGWSAERLTNPTGRVLAVPVTHDPQLRKPFGRSRLTNSVMGLCDMAVRAYVRMEGNAEFYSSPQIALLGVDAEAFAGGIPESQKFKLAQDRLIALTKDVDGDKPVLQQLQQASMLPHSDMLRTVAMAFSGETGIPPSSLGVLHDQPASAEAIRAAEHDLLIDAYYQNRYVLSSSADEIARLAVLVRDGVEHPESWKIRSRFSDPEFRSMSAQADATSKLAQTMDALAQHPVLLEQVFDSDEVERILSDVRRADARSVLDRVLGASDAVE